MVKIKIYNLEHLQKRLKQRYNLDFNVIMYQKFLSDINQNKAKLLFKKDNHSKIYCIEWQKQEIVLIYDTKDKVIKTFLPSNNYKAQQLQLKCPFCCSKDIVSLYFGKLTFEKTNDILKNRMKHAGITVKKIKYKDYYIRISYKWFCNVCNKPFRYNFISLKQIFENLDLSNIR